MSGHVARQDSDTTAQIAALYGNGFAQEAQGFTNLRHVERFLEDFEKKLGDLTDEVRQAIDKDIADLRMLVGVHRDNPAHEHHEQAHQLMGLLQARLTLA